MKIKITRGIYGKKEGERIVEKTPHDPPFDIEEQEGERLVGLGVAAEMIRREPVQDIEEGMDPEQEEDENTGIGEGEAHISKEQLVGMKINDLRRLAGEMGIERSGSKEELAERIAGIVVDLEDEDDMPDMIPAEPE